MPRYRSPRSRTEEQKMKLNVDLRCVPEWEAELKAMPELFRENFPLSLSKILSAKALLLETGIKADNMYGLDGNAQGDMERVQGALAQLKSPLTVDDLFDISYGYFRPSYYLQFYEIDILCKMESRLRESEITNIPF